jgi:hypothetical protein
MVVDPSEMQVRSATGNDAEAIQGLYRELVPGDGNIKVDAGRVEALRSDPHNRLLVLEADGQVCGTAFLTVCLDSMYGFQPFGTVENLIVAMLLSSATRAEAHVFFSRVGFDGEKKRGFVKYLNRTRPLVASG